MRFIMAIVTGNSPSLPYIVNIEQFRFTPRIILQNFKCTFSISFSVLHSNSKQKTESYSFTGALEKIHNTNHG